MVLGFLVVLSVFATCAALVCMWRGGYRLISLLSAGAMLVFLVLLPQIAALFSR